MTGRERLLAFLDGRPVDSLPLMPITMMFAADTIGRPYRDYATDHRALVRGQHETAQRYDLDHVSVISDPAREAADCGATVVMFPDQPPAIDETDARLADPSSLRSLAMPDPLGGGRMTDRIRGVAALEEEAGQDKVIEGWIEGPCAEAADLRGINTLMLDFSDDPDFVRELFDFAVRMGLQFAEAQVRAGADIIGIGDAAASLIGPKRYDAFVWPFEKRLVDGIHAMGARVRLHICGDTRSILAGMGRLGCDIIDLDSPSPLEQARRVMGPDQVLLGNIHPVGVLRDGTPESIEAAIRACHAAAGPRYIVGAGCEVPRGTPPENLLALTHYARSTRP